MSRLGEVCRARGLETLSDRLAVLATLVVPDVERVEQELRGEPQRREDATSPAGGAGGREAPCRQHAGAGFREDRVGRSASHLVRLGGKRLRPVCVALAARLDPREAPLDVSGALDLAVAVELVHNATLLHDDVVDAGEVRRGAPAARVIYGNAASIFAGDWLLVEALRRVRASGVAKVLDALLGVIDQMIEAEAVQLDQRGRLDVEREVYFRVIEGKTASLFGWATYAGGRAARLSDERCAALASFGRHLGVAFQAVDDLLDFSGDEKATGKALFADLREGKVTYPLIVAMEREPSLRARVRSLVEAAERGEDVDDACAQVRSAMERTGAITECAGLAERSAQSAIDALESLPSGPARDALATVAEATVHRIW